MHRTGTKHIVCHMQKSLEQWSVMSKFTCIVFPYAASGKTILLLFSYASSGKHKEIQLLLLNA